LASLNGWKQTVVVVISVVSTAVASSLWVQSRFYQIQERLTLSEVEREAIRLRITSEGFSRAQAQRFVDELRTKADHPVPPLTSWSRWRQ
jgi:hypothetical protein